MIRILQAIALAVVAGAAWMIAMPAPPSSQPLAFNHAKHAGTTCAVCHSGVETGTSARLPDTSVCLNCHATAPASVRADAWDALVRRERAGWMRVTRLPAHVMFSHQRHVRSGRLECASCHGDIGQRSAPPPRAPVRLEMSACLQCHRREAASQDCAACHR